MTTNNSVGSRSRYLRKGRKRWRGREREIKKQQQHRPGKQHQQVRNIPGKQQQQVTAASAVAATAGGVTAESTGRSVCLSARATSGREENMQRRSKASRAQLRMDGSARDDNRSRAYLEQGKFFGGSQKVKKGKRGKYCWIR